MYIYKYVYLELRSKEKRAKKVKTLSRPRNKQNKSRRKWRLSWLVAGVYFGWALSALVQHTATHCNTLQHTATLFATENVCAEHAYSYCIRAFNLQWCTCVFPYYSYVRDSPLGADVAQRGAAFKLSSCTLGNFLKNQYLCINSHLRADVAKRGAAFKLSSCTLNFLKNQYKFKYTATFAPTSRKGLQRNQKRIILSCCTLFLSPNKFRQFPRRRRREREQKNKKHAFKLWYFDFSRKKW